MLKMYSILTSLLLTIIGLHATHAMDNLKVAYQWKILDFNYPTLQARQNALTTKEFIPENNLPLGLEVYKDRLFVTIPRWKSGVAASLAFIKLTDPMESPKLTPYPNWESHKIRSAEDPPQIVSPFRIRADSCDRLWVLDTGVANVLEETKVLSKTKILIYDLIRDQLIRSYTIPSEQMHANDSFFANIAVEENDCENSFAYLADLGHPGLVVYSFKDEKSWLVKHNYFNIHPLAGEMNVAGITFEWSDGLFGLALSSSDSEGYSTLFFHPLTSFNEFSVSTRVLRDESMATNQTANFKEFKLLGSRGPKAQSGPSFLDKKSNVLFYSLVNLNAVACWRTTNPTYTMESQGRVFMSNVTMLFPNDIKVDADDNLWVLSDKLPIFMYKNLDYNDYNFRIMTAKVADAIRGTACDSKMVVNTTIINKINNVIAKETGRSNGGRVEYGFVSFVVFVVAIFLR